MSKLLLIDDEEDVRYSFQRIFDSPEIEIITASSGEEGLKVIPKFKPDLVLMDVRMGGMNGLETLRKIRAGNPKLLVILMTAYGTTQTAIEAMKLGAYDYLQKPFELKELADFVERVMKSHVLHTSSHATSEIITQNPTYLGVLRMAERVANSPLTVLIEGETGTGKELVADFIHKRSDRAENPIVKLNCAALSSELIESELFGHVKGAFTGALKDRVGRVEAANGGTLFLDEIGEIPPAMQAKLLRFLQSREFQRVGENETRYADVRIIAATNRNLEEAIQRGEFREDLFYRLSGVRLLIPPLRLRREDILPLAEAFVAGVSKGALPEMSEAVRAALLGYEWRGNVRELENTMLRATVLAGNRRTIELEDLPAHIGSGSSNVGEYSSSGNGMAALRSLEEVERDYIAQVISRTSSLEEAARILKIDSATLWRKRKKYSL